MGFRKLARKSKQNGTCLIRPSTRPNPIYEVRTQILIKLKNKQIAMFLSKPKQPALFIKETERLKLDLALISLDDILWLR